MSVEHIVPISGGKDSVAAGLLAIERAERHSMRVRFQHSITDNDHPITLEYLDYLERMFGQRIERVRADFTDALAHRRETIQVEWSKEKRRKEHTSACKARRDALSAKAWRRACDCPVRVSPPVDQAIIDRAKALLYPSGNLFLDLCKLKGRFPSRTTQFCTEALKVEPSNAVVHPIIEAGGDVVIWSGERADESPKRAAKPAMQRIRWPKPGGSLVLYRPIHRWAAKDCFAIAQRHGVRPNPLYLMGFKRVGCSTCINEDKNGIRQTAERFPERIDQKREWEAIVALVSRRGDATFFGPMIGDEINHIDDVVAWANTTRGGRQFDLLQAIRRDAADEIGAMCESAYGLCE